MKKSTKIVAGALAAALTLSMGGMLMACNSGTEYTFEAEDAALAGNARAEEGKHVWAGVDNIGTVEDTIDVVGYFGTEGDTITWTIVSSKACSATITVTAASTVNGNGASAMGEEGWKTLEIDTSKNEVFTLSVNGTQASLSGVLPGLEATWEEIGQNMMAMFDYGYNNHGTCTAKVQLKEGENTIVLAAVSSGINVDKISIKAPAELTAKA